MPAKRDPSLQTPHPRFASNGDNNGSHQYPTILYLGLLLGIILTGTLGYHLIEGWGIFDSFYMTVITLSTIGYGETHPLSTLGRAFTVALIFVGLGIGTVLLGATWQRIVEGQFNRIFNRRKRMHDKIAKLTQHTVFCGYSRLGKQAALELASADHVVVVIEKDEVRASDAETQGFLVVRGDATLEETITAAGIRAAARLVTLLPRDSDNLYVILNAREVNPAIKIVTRAEDEVGGRRLKRAGADLLISSYALAARKLADGLLRPQINEFFEVAGSGESGWKIEEIRIPDNSRACGQTLGQLALRQRAKVGIAAVISAGGELEINPDGETVIEAGATLIAIGWNDDLRVLESSVLGG
jgi:voltage-gated potassium channel